jgi:flagellar hook-basal body complex protein FliE
MPLPMTPIQPIAVPELVTSHGTIGNDAAPSGASFGSALTDAIGALEQFQQNAGTSVSQFLSGQDEEIHKVALATEQASLSFDLFLQVRNKVVSAYQEVMRMQM